MFLQDLSDHVKHLTKLFQNQQVQENMKKHNSNGNWFKHFSKVIFEIRSFQVILLEVFFKSLYANYCNYPDK